MKITSIIKVCTVVLFILYSSFGISQANKFPAGQFKLNIEGRPSSPYSVLQNYNADLTAQGCGPSFSVTVSRHHIIPFNMLKAFYNRVAERGRLRNLSGFFNHYSNNLYLYAGSNGVDCDRLGNDLVDAGNLGLAQSYGMVTAGGSHSALGFDTFEQFYAWLPGNLFIGPNNRSDDPHEGFESNADVVVGAANFYFISRAYQNINLYLSNNDDSLLNAISVDLSKMAGRKSIYKLNPDNWEFVNGQYRLSKSKKSLSTFPPSDAVRSPDACKESVPTFLNTLSAALLLNNSTYKSG